MAKVSAFINLPDIVPYDEEDEELKGVKVGTYEDCKRHVLKVLAEYAFKLNAMTYHEWKEVWKKKKQQKTP